LTDRIVTAAESAPRFAQDRIAEILRLQACDPAFVRLFREPNADVMTPPARAGVQWRADWIADADAVVAAARDGGFGLAVATDTALQTPIADLMIAAVELRAPGAVSDDLRERISTAVHEATVNACVHGNLGISGGGARDVDAFYAAIAAGANDDRRALKTVTISAAIAQGELVVDIRDQGEGFAPANDEVRPEQGYTGRGLSLIRTFADGLELLDGGRHIRLSFRLEDAGDAA